MISRHETTNGEDSVIVRSDETPTYETYTRGTKDPLYVGDSLNDAAQSLEMNEQQFNDLIMSDDADDVE